MVSELLFPAPPVASLPLRGDARRIPVRRIYCVGRNYTDHIREMGGDEREPPFFFQKPTDALVQPGAVVPYPSSTTDFQHEVELVLAIGRAGRCISADESQEYVCAFGVGIDLTRRDVQVLARKAGRPWEIGKSFDASAPCSELILSDSQRLPSSGRIELMVNGEVRQRGDLAEMIWSAAEIVSKLSELYSLMPGDLIFTGTPAGVGPVVPGDKLRASIEDVASLDISVGPNE